MTLIQILLCVYCSRFWVFSNAEYNTRLRCNIGFPMVRTFGKLKRMAAILFLDHFIWVDFINYFGALCPWANHRDCSIHLRPMPNFLRSFLLMQKFGTRGLGCKRFMKSTLFVITIFGICTPTVLTDSFKI